MYRLSIVFCLFLLVGCEENFIPFTPSPLNGSSSALPEFPNSPNPLGADLQSWSPYIVVHGPYEALGAYQVAIPALQAAGRLKGVRLGIVKSEGINLVNQWIASVVPDVLWIFDNYFLFEEEIEREIDRVMTLYSIKYLQIGNETTTILPNPGPQISIEGYMQALKRIYNYVQVRYPSVILVTQSTFGGGAIELERMINLGLRDMSPDKLIISMNIYSTENAVSYSHVINRSGLRGYRIWITETGVADTSRHLGFMNDFYPILLNNIRPERIYWYCLYCGEEDQYGDHWEFGLIRGIFNPMSLWTSPLYDALIGAR